MNTKYFHTVRIRNMDRIVLSALWASFNNQDPIKMPENTIRIMWYDSDH